MLLILGGSQGLGAEIANLYREKKTDLLTAGRTGDLKHDLSDLTSTRRLVTKIEEFAKFNRAITEFYWVAGTLTRGEFENLKEDEILNMIDVNFRNSSLVAAAVWREMKKHPEVPRRFVVVSSTTGLSETPSPLEVVYAATKAAQISMARALGKPNTDERLKVSLFCPGGMKTGFWDENEIEQKTYDGFLDPAKVARAIFDDVKKQKTPYAERVIPRDSL